MISRSKQKTEENPLVELFSTIKPYKWSIFSITAISAILTLLYLYFQPSIYESYAIIKIKSETRGGERLRDIDPLSSALSISGNSEVDQELAILKTFYTNNRAIERLANKKPIEKIDLKIQYFKEEGYKEVEIFLEFPIDIREIKFFNKDILGEKIKLIPAGDGFRIKIDDTIASEIYNYGESVKTNKFRFIVDKKSKLKKPIYFKFNGNNRNIYEKIIRKNLKVSRLNENVSLIKVAYQDTSPSRATAYINALVDVYIAQSIKDKSKKNNKILDFIEEQLGNTGKKLKLSESQLEEYRVSNSVIEPSIQSEALINRLSTVEVELSENSIRERLISNLLTFVKHNKNLDSITPTLRELEDEPTIRVIERLQDLQRRASELRRDFTEKHPDLRAVRRDIARSKRTILLNIESLKSNISARKKDLISLKKEYEESLKTLPTKEKQLIGLRRNYEVNSKMYSYLLEKKSENEMKKVATISDYEIVDRAYSNGIPIKPKRLSSLVIFTLFGSVFAVLLSLLRNFMINRVQNIKEVERLTTLPIYGSLPITADTGFEISDHPESKLSENFRSIRTTLQFIRKVDKSNIILVTSNAPKEGKTVITANLCAIFQMADYRSIVIDLNLYRPEIHNYFNITNDKGISDYLLNKRDKIEDIILPTAYPNLDIITAGHSVTNPSDLILSDKLESLIARLKKEYDFIFIDTAPFSMVADTLYLMQHADINLIVIREQIAKKSFVSNLEDMVKQHGIKNVGLVINGTTELLSDSI
ncbi:polysaccharide biosynthesis tyrosine autokinase [Sulfurovum sp. bin170]|uniref:GumC family protein n=1 Tax=Sulfurovum sp. bin170 TaxID=2695268 RepID=UPI0013DFAC28|nr:tyrosine-protein kinase [Sulfurovum sp. bin170]NEW60634.1 polysaccharide biosynthesis tyrosine autokinase [Sulfurovum sp. bin170]